MQTINDMTRDSVHTIDADALSSILSTQACIATASYEDQYYGVFKTPSALRVIAFLPYEGAERFETVVLADKASMKDALKAMYDQVCIDFDLLIAETTMN
jgi:hypothetical protein